MVLPERGERAPVARLGQARMVPSRRAEVDRDYIDHRCPTCDHALKVRAAYAGKSVVCKFCDCGFVADLAPPRPVIFPIAAHRLPPVPPSDVIEYLASRVAEAGERNRRLAAEHRQLRDQIDGLHAELLQRSRRPADLADAVGRDPR